MPKYMINWENHQDILDWKEVAEEKQQFYCAYLAKSKWEVYDANDLRYLRLKIGYSLFGPPLNLQDNDVEASYRDPNYKTKIDTILSTIKSKNKNDSVLYISFIYVIANVDYKYSEFPIIRLLKRREEGKDICSFIDTLGYCYKTWEKFLQTNVMPKCIYCYPREGFYSCELEGRVELDYGYSPQNYSFISKGMGVMSAVGGAVGSAVTGVLPAVTPETKVVVAESVVRGVEGSARGRWITVASVDSFCSVFAVHSTRAVAASVLQSDEVCPLLARALERGPVRPNWFAVLNLMPLILKHVHRITLTHIAQLFVPILFFCHAVVSYDTCKQILKETLNDMTNNAKPNLSHKSRCFLKEMKEKLVKKCTDEAVLRIKKIDSKSDLFEEIMPGENESLDENGNITVENFLKSNSKDNDSVLHKIASYCYYLEQVTNNCANCREKIEDAKKLIGQLPDLRNWIKERDESDSLKKIECSLKEGTCEVFHESLEEGLQPLDYYHKFVHQRISEIKPQQFYVEKEAPGQSWVFVLPEENCGLKMIKINVLKVVEEEAACVKVFYY